jgi:desulfoferrodoxin (superoxide reductase-like protein)
MPVLYPLCWHVPRLLQRFEEHVGLIVVADGVVAVGEFAREMKSKYWIWWISLMVYRHMMAVDFDNEDHNMDKDMSKHNHQLDVEHIHHHLYILRHCPNR